jgi:hypothetical protein
MHRCKGQMHIFKGQMHRFKGQMHRYKGQMHRYKGQMHRYKGQMYSIKIIKATTISINRVNKINHLQYMYQIMHRQLQHQQIHCSLWKPRLQFSLHSLLTACRICLKTWACRVWWKIRLLVILRPRCVRNFAHKL